MKRFPWTLLLIAASFGFGAVAFAQEIGVQPKNVGDSPKHGNFFSADNGLGAVGVASVGLYLSEIAFHTPEPWRGYPPGESGLSSGDSFGPQNGQLNSTAACATSNGAAVAKALTTNAPAPVKPPQGVIRSQRGSDVALSAVGGDNQTAGYDVKAIYQPPPSFDCPEEKK